MPNETEKLIEEAQWYARRIGDYDGVPTELEDVLDGVVAALRLSQAERDAVLKQSAAWEIQAQDLRDRLVKAEAERDAQHDLVLRLTAERDEARVVHACPPKGSGVMPCCGATPFEKQGERLTTNPVLVTCDRQRLAADLDEARAQVWGLICAGTNMAERRRHFQGLWEALLADGLKRDAQLSELTATCDLLTAENARLQKEHNAYVQRLSADALQVASKYQRDLDEARAQIATLELLQRGGK